MPRDARHQRRGFVSPGAVAVEHEDLPVVSRIGVLDHRHAAVIQRQPASVDFGGGDGVVFTAHGIVHDHDPKVLRRNAGKAEADEFGDRVILAIAGAPA